MYAQCSIMVGDEMHKLVNRVIVFEAVDVEIVSRASGGK